MRHVCLLGHQTHGQMNNMWEKKRMAQEMSKRDGEEMKERMDHGMASRSTPSFSIRRMTVRFRRRREYIRFNYMHTRFGSQG